MTAVSSASLRAVRTFVQRVCFLSLPLPRRFRHSVGRTLTPLLAARSTDVYHKFQRRSDVRHVEALLQQQHQRRRPRKPRNKGRATGRSTNCRQATAGSADLGGLFTERGGGSARVGRRNERRKAQWRTVYGSVGGTGGRGCERCGEGRCVATGRNTGRRSATNGASEREDGGGGGGDEGDLAASGRVRVKRKRVAGERAPRTSGIRGRRRAPPAETESACLTERRRASVTMTTAAVYQRPSSRQADCCQCFSRPRLTATNRRVPTRAGRLRATGARSGGSLSPGRRRCRGDEPAARG